MYVQQLLCFKALITVRVWKAENASLPNQAYVHTMAVGL